MQKKGKKKKIEKEKVKRTIMTLRLQITHDLAIISSFCFIKPFVIVLI